MDLGEGIATRDECIDHESQHLATLVPLPKRDAREACEARRAHFDTQFHILRSALRSIAHMRRSASEGRFFGFAARYLLSAVIVSLRLFRAESFITKVLNLYLML